MVYKLESLGLLEYVRKMAPNLMCFQTGCGTFYYLIENKIVYEMSSLDSTVRVLSLEDYDKLVVYYTNNDESAFDVQQIKYKEVNGENEKDDSHEDYYVFNTPYHLLKL